MTERAQIVAWLRGRVGHGAVAAAVFADKIENGEHEDMPAPETNPDATLARRAAKIGTPSALLVAALFGIRACAGCDPDNTGPVEFRYHGNHCGPGHGTDAPPVDELDAACRDHDLGVGGGKGADDGE